MGTGYRASKILILMHMRKVHGYINRGWPAGLQVDNAYKLDCDVCIASYFKFGLGGGSTPNKRVPKSDIFG